MNAWLELLGLEKTYPDGTRAVKGIDFAAEQGEFIVLLGPSGCGKTTTLRMTAGLELPTGGAIRLAGQDVSQQRPSQRDVGFVFQFYALYPHLTVAENLAFPLECSGASRAEREAAVAELAARLELGSLLSRRPRELSGGDQQRVALGRAMIRRPKIWLMDEPLGTLDTDRRLAMCEFLRSQQLEARVTTLYVTHDQEEAMRLADRIVVMNDGRIEQVGPPMSVYDQPASLFVAHFVGSPGMNFLDGTIEHGGGDARFAPNGGSTALPLPAALKSVRDGPATLGVRPEFVRLAAPGASGALHGEVALSEYLGASRGVHVQTACGMLVARVEPDAAVATGSAVSLAFDAEHVRLFDPAGGGRLA
jgi:multiple sugar transport system ATP-binding protein